MKSLCPPRRDGRDSYSASPRYTPTPLLFSSLFIFFYIYDIGLVGGVTPRDFPCLERVLLTSGVDRFSGARVVQTVADEGVCPLPICSYFA
jgi:hypothetical protein